MPYNFFPSLNISKLPVPLNLSFLYSEIQGSDQQPLEREILKKTKPIIVNKENSNPNAPNIEIEEVGEDLYADSFISLDEYGQPIKNKDAKYLFNWTDDESSDTIEAHTNR